MLQRVYIFSGCYTEDALLPFNPEDKYLIMVIFITLSQKNKNNNSYHLLVVNFTTTYKDNYWPQFTNAVLEVEEDQIF